MAGINRNTRKNNEQNARPDAEIGTPNGSEPHSARAVSAGTGSRCWRRGRTGVRAMTQERHGCGTLVLSRREGESILIGDDVRITVLQAKGKQVRFAVKAPQHMRIRQERGDGGGSTEPE